MPPANPDHSDISGRLPLHVQVSEMLAREIQAGILPDGSKLAPEREMAHDLEISVGTLRKALADLTGKGLLERVQGSGNYVRNTADAATIYGFFRLELVDGGGLPTADILSISRMRKARDLPQFGKSDAAFRFRRLRRLNGTRAAVEEIWLDGSCADTISRKDVSDSLYQYYRTALNLWIVRAEDKVGVAPPPEWKPEDFRSNASVWGHIERMSFDRNNDAVEFSRTWFDPSVSRYMARLK